MKGFLIHLIVYILGIVMSFIVHTFIIDVTISVQIIFVLGWFFYSLAKYLSNER